MAGGVPPLSISYWVQAMKTPASALEDLCWPIRVHHGQHLQCQDQLPQIQGVSEVKRCCFLRKIYSKRLPSARALYLRKKLILQVCSSILKSCTQSIGARSAIIRDLCLWKEYFFVSFSSFIMLYNVDYFLINTDIVLYLCNSNNIKEHGKLDSVFHL